MVGQNTSTRGIINQGNLELENVTFQEPNTMNTVGPILENKNGGTLTVKGSVKVVKE